MGDLARSGQINLKLEVPAYYGKCSVELQCTPEQAAQLTFYGLLMLAGIAIFSALVND